MSSAYAPFLAYIPPSGRILDAGCGSGRDSRHFLQQGYEVVAFDASGEMCRLASTLIGQTVHQKGFDDIDWVSEFDGIWACASLLHLRRNSIDSVLHKLRRALKPNGVMFVSFKLRDEEWEEDGRFFNGYDQASFPQLIRGHPALACKSIWISEDVRPDRKGKMWLNAILQNVRSHG
jgi:SAM-dependent methyltransferase